MLSCQESARSSSSAVLHSHPPGRPQGDDSLSLHHALILQVPATALLTTLTPALPSGLSSGGPGDHAGGGDSPGGDDPQPTEHASKPFHLH